jgi:ribosomal protein S20
MKNESAYNETIKNMLKNMREAVQQAQKIGDIDTAKKHFHRVQELQELQELAKKKGL